MRTDLSDVRVPMSVAARQGVVAVAANVEHGWVLPTNDGQPVAVVDSAERLDADLRRVRDAARSVVEVSADLALNRRPPVHRLEDVCARLKVDAEVVRDRAAALVRAGTENVAAIAPNSGTCSAEEM